MSIETTTHTATITQASKSETLTLSGPGIVTVETVILNGEALDTRRLVKVEDRRSTDAAILQQGDSFRINAGEQAVTVSLLSGLQDPRIEAEIRFHVGEQRLTTNARGGVEMPFEATEAVSLSSGQSHTFSIHADDTLGRVRGRALQLEAVSLSFGGDLTLDRIALEGEDALQGQLSSRLGGETVLWQGTQSLTDPATRASLPLADWPLSLPYLSILTVDVTSPNGTDAKISAFGRAR